MPAAASVALRALVEDRAPKRPYCGLTKIARIRDREAALSMPFLQLNPPALESWLILDIDRECSGFEAQDAGLPEPTFVLLNPENRHSQVGYALAAPVCTSSAARRRPVRYLAAIEAGYNRRVGGDLAFQGPLSKNPLFEGWHLIEPAAAPTYELGLLAEYVDLPNRLPRRRAEVEAEVEVGGRIKRNCTLFDRLAEWARRAVRGFWRPGGETDWSEACLSHAETLNCFTPPLTHSEVRGIARSVSRWTWRNCTPVGFREWQAAMGVRSGATRRNGSLAESQPWVDLGISRRTWFRRQKSGLLAPP